jgi:asparagine synthase (glutamine-hydrolysing)
MSIYALAEHEKGRVKRIYASCRFPSIQRGNILQDFEGEINLINADELPLHIRDFFSVVAIRPSHILLSRDVLGGRPLYYDPATISASSFRDYLDLAVEIVPGEVLKLDYDGRVLERKLYSFEDVFSTKILDEDEEKIKDEILEELKGFRAEGCVAFSGGVDSSLLASIYDLDLISVTARESEEKWLTECSKMLGKRVEIKRFDLDDVEKILPAVIRTIETYNPLQVAIAIPVFLTVQFAKENGFSSVVFGQGADELFGGYRRYAELSGVRLREELIDDVRNIGRNNLVRDVKIAYTHEIRLLTPYLNWDMIQFALRIPPEMKVRKFDGNIVRKYILRRAAREYLPPEIAFRDKKAVQYSTGAMDLLRKLARKNGMKVEGYLRKIGERGLIRTDEK